MRCVSWNKQRSRSNDDQNSWVDGNQERDTERAGQVQILRQVSRQGAEVNRTMQQVHQAEGMRENVSR